MIRNKVVLDNQLHDKLVGKCLTALVTEAFISALPFDESEVTKQCKSFGKYSTAVIESLHPETLLNRALESVQGDMMATAYLTDMKTAIESIVDEACNRIAKENENSFDSTPDIVKNANLDKKEIEKLVKVSKDLDSERVAEIIKDKVIDTIKQEKEAYAKSEEIKSEIEDVIHEKPNDKEPKSTDDVVDPSTDDNTPSETPDQTVDDTAASLDSYLDIILDKGDAREHVSFFTKLNDVCTESLLYSSEEYDEVPFKTLEKITMESTLPIFDIASRSIQDDLTMMQIITESMCEEHNHDGEDPEEKKKHKMKKISKTAFICTITILTLLETLKSMHMIHPSHKEIKDFVDVPSEIHKEHPMSALALKIHPLLKDIHKSAAMGSLNTVEVDNLSKKLISIKESLSQINCTSEEENAAKEEMIANIDKELALKKHFEEEHKDEHDAQTADPQTFIEYNKAIDNNAVYVAKAIKMLNIKPLVKRILINANAMVENDTKVDKIAIYGLDETDTRVAEYFIDLEMPFGCTNEGEILIKTLEFMKDEIGSKPIMIHYRDTQVDTPYEITLDDE